MLDQLQGAGLGVAYAFSVGELADEDALKNHQTDLAPIEVIWFESQHATLTRP